MKPIITNQFSVPINRIIERLEKLNWEPLYILPSGIECLALVIVLIIFIVLWPYGLFPMIVTLIWQLIEESIDEIKVSSFSSAVPHTVAIGIYFIISLPFVIICLPLYAIGFIGKFLSDLDWKEK